MGRPRTSRKRKTGGQGATQPKPARPQFNLDEDEEDDGDSKGSDHDGQKKSSTVDAAASALAGLQHCGRPDLSNPNHHRRSTTKEVCHHHE